MIQFTVIELLAKKRNVRLYIMNNKKLHLGIRLIIILMAFTKSVELQSLLRFPFFGDDKLDTRTKFIFYDKK